MKDTNTVESSVSALLTQRNELDAKIRTEHTCDVTVFFCDIMGYTSYTETHGDLASRAFCKQLTDIAFPALEEFNGHFVKTIGDAIMAYFDAPEQAVRYAIALLQRLKIDNQNRPKINRVTIRIGMNLGEAIIDEGDLYGDSVNIAARIEPQAHPNSILISPTLFDEVQNFDDITCLYAKEINAKGKTEPIKLYQVVWDGDRCDDYSAEGLNQNVSEENSSSTTLKAKGKWSTPAKLVAAIVVIFAIVFLKTFITNQNQTTPERHVDKTVLSVLDPYVDGYAALRTGDVAGAAKLFEQINVQGPQYFETKAALNYWQNDFDNATIFTKKAISKDHDRIFPHVIDGNLKFRKALLGEAYSSFQKGADQEKGNQWHKALAYNGLARVSAAMGKEEMALSQYQKALALKSGDSEIITNYGVLLEHLGRNKEALSAYKDAVEINPNDDLANNRLHFSLRQEKIKLDNDKQSRINKLVDDLAAQYKKGTPQIRTPVTTVHKLSVPLSTWLVGFDDKGDVPKREGENDVFTDLLSQNLLNSGTVELVERALLDKLLAELKLGSSELASQNTSLQLGRLLAAKILIKGNIYRRSGETMINYKVIETETSRIKVTATVMVENNKNIFSYATAVSDEISKKLNSAYPDI